MKIGIIGAESAKFNSAAEGRAKYTIDKILGQTAVPTLVSGRCPLAECQSCHNLKFAPPDAPLSGVFLCPACNQVAAVRTGGVDIWAEEIWDACALLKQIYYPIVNAWNPYHGYGFKARNLDIARNCDELHVILVANYLPTYKGTRFEECYHCRDMPPSWCGRQTKHVKSGACYTAIHAAALKKPVYYHVIDI